MIEPNKVKKFKLRPPYLLECSDWLHALLNKNYRRSTNIKRKLDSNIIFCIQVKGSLLAKTISSYSERGFMRSIIHLLLEFTYGSGELCSSLFCRAPHLLRSPELKSRVKSKHHVCFSYFTMQSLVAELLSGAK